MATRLLYLLAFVVMAVADYDCICNYSVEEKIHDKPVDSSGIIGYMYEFDCKEYIAISTLDASWKAVAFEHHIGYIKDSSSLLTQTCQGSPPSEDKVASTTTAAPTTTTTTTSITTSTTTTPAQTTATTQSTTSTQQPTTPIPTPTTTTTSTTTTTTPQPTTTSPTPTTTTKKPTTITTTPATTTRKPTTTKPQPTTTTPKPTTTQAPTTTTYRPTTTTTTTQPATTTQRTTSSTPKPTTHKPVTYAPVTVPSPGTPCYYTYHNYAGNIKGSLVSYGHSCYEVVTSQLLWAAAETDCRTKGGDLVHIDNAQEQNFIYNYLKTHYDHRVWIGLHDHKQEEKFEWISGHPVTYTHWSPNRYSILHLYQNCVELDPTDGGFWKDRTCDALLAQRYGYVCQYGSSGIVLPAVTNPPVTSAPVTHAPIHVPTHAPTNAPTTVYTAGPDGDIQLCQSKHRLHAQKYGTVLAHFGSSCYELISTQKMTWQHAELLCRSGGGHLAHIGSASEQAFIEGVMKRHQPQDSAWIGLHDLNYEGYYQWSSGDRVSYLNFVPNHLSDYRDRGYENCFILMPYKNGQWDDIPCGSTNPFTAHDYGFIYAPLCQFSASAGYVSIIG